MKKAIQPYLHFEDNCKEAMQFYQSIFGGELELMVVGESPAKEEFTEEYHHQILHSSLRNGDFVIMACVKRLCRTIAFISGFMVIPLFPGGTILTVTFLPFITSPLMDVMKGFQIV